MMRSATERDKRHFREPDIGATTVHPSASLKVRPWQHLSSRARSARPPFLPAATTAGTVARTCPWGPDGKPDFGAARASGGKLVGGWYCTQCGAVGNQKKYTKGSFGIEILLYLLMILPGLLYSVWRLTTKYAGCPKCQAANMIPVSSPVAQAALRAVAKKDPLDGPPAPWRTRADTHTGPHGFVAVVGESHYQETLRGLSVMFKAIERTERTFTATLAPEPTNPHDPNAVVVTMHDGTTIGYLAREMAATFQKRLLLRRPAVLKCPAQLRGGENGESIGVVLDLSEVHV